MVHPRKGSAALAAGAAVLALGACTGGGGNGATPTGRSDATTHPSTGGSVPGTTAPSPDHSAPTRTHPIVLRCTDGQTGLNVPTAARAHVGGLVSFFLAGSPGNFSSYPRLAIGEDDYVAIKSVLYATAQAGPHSTVTLISPASARMFYTDWSHWAGVQDVPSTARSVTVASCSGQTVGYPGFLLVTGPTCLTYRITAAGNQKAENRTVPIGRHMC